MGSTIRAHEPQAADPGTVRPNAVVAGQPQGMDVSNYQSNINWSSAAANGAKFVYTKATEGTSFIDSTFGDHYDGAYNAGLIRGAYHFALPDRSSGAAQATFFVRNGGAWSADGMTLPPMLDIEYNPYGPTCYGLSGSGMASWIRDFSNTVHSLTGRYATIYSTRGWWNQCTGSDSTFGATNPLFLACYCSGPGTMPPGWDYQTIWQYADAGIFPGDQDVFNGSMDQLRTFAALADGPVPVTPPLTPASTPPPATGGTGGVAPAASVFNRIAGVDRYDTSAQTAAQFGSSSTVILASGEVGHSVDALSAAYLAGVNHAPILLTRNSSTPPEVLAQIQVSGAHNIVVVGGSGSVSDAQLAALQSAGYTLTRLGGVDRYATSARVIAAAGKSGGTTALLASGTVFADALGAGPLSYAKGIPLAITDPNVLPATVLAALQNAGIANVLIVGGTASVTQNVRDQLTAAGITVSAPFAGADRSQTSTLLAQYEIAHYGFTNTAVNVASGSTAADGADALGGAALSGTQGRPLLITNNTNDPGFIPALLATNAASLTTGTLFGGAGAISQALQNALNTR